MSALHGDALHVRELVATVVGAEPALDADHALRSVSLIEKVWPGLNFKSSFKLDLFLALPVGTEFVSALVLLL